MKKLLAIAGIVLFGIGQGYCAQPRGVGSIQASKIAFDQRTLAQINALVPDTTGQIVLCNDCTTSTVCISSGAAASHTGAFVILVASGPFVGATFSGLPHCQ